MITDETKEEKNVDSSKSEFSYSIYSIPGKIKKRNIFADAFSPRNSSKTKMYILFLIGTITLLFISYLVLKDLRIDGISTYVNNFNTYLSNNPENANSTLIIMFVVNIFWILINVIIEFLAVSQEWIPKPSDHRTSFAEQNLISVGKNTINPTKFSKFNEELFIKNLQEKFIEENKEDEIEYNAILHNPLLSPLAFLWIGVKRIYRFVSHFNSWCNLFYHKMISKYHILITQTKEWLSNTWELFIYFLNPINLIEEVIDVSITILVRILYPAILTPVIFFLPIFEKFYFTNIYQIIIYILMIGGLRVGVEFFSIYIRFLRNTRVR